MTSELPEAAAALYLVSPEEFTSERDRLARELKEAGESEAALKVKSLKRPTVAAYALNLIASRQPAEIKSLLEADDQLRNASTRDEMETAKLTRQRTITSITTAALSILREQARSTGNQIKEKISETLLAVANDDDARELLENGTLTREIAPGNIAAASVFGLLESDEPDEPMDDRKTQRVKDLRAESDVHANEAKRLRRESDLLVEESQRLKRESERLQAQALKSEEAAERKLKQAGELRG